MFDSLIMEHVLVARFSALGDVAMTVPVVASLARQYPQLRITMLSRSAYRPLFEGLSSNVTFWGADVKGMYHGVWGLRRLASDLQLGQFTAFADLHDVLRTKYLRFRCRTAGIPTAHVHKDRAARAALTRSEHKDLTPQPPVFSRYADVFRTLGYPLRPAFDTLFAPSRRGEWSALSSDWPPKGEGERWVGIAPFAAHPGKVYPLNRMEEVVAALSGYPAVRVFLFGAGAQERAILEAWQQRYPCVRSVAGRLGSLRNELVLMSHLDVMLSMDSANMHLASLVQVPVVSVWGATHPCAGFLGWGQPLSQVVQVDLPCRPCSVYGNLPCRRKDYACLTRITPEAIVERIKAVVPLDTV